MLIIKIKDKKLKKLCVDVGTTQPPQNVHTSTQDILNIYTQLF